MAEEHELRTEDASAGILLLRGKKVSTATRDIEISRLRFYIDNPRIYSFVRTSGHIPTQSEILAQLHDMEHVRRLVQDIRGNGGLIDPMIVRDGDMVVLEGNSRLAAYHFLSQENPLKWSSARCTLLPSDIDEKLVYALLAQYHVKGKKDWVPYEKAGFIYRRFNDQQVNLDVAAPEMGLTKEEAKHLIAVYQFMIDYEDHDRDHWSHYDELLKSRKIKKARAEVAGMEEFVVAEIKAERFGKAADLRDKLPTICGGHAKVLKRYMDGTYDLAEAHEAAVAAGGENHALSKLKRFRKWLTDATIEDDLTEAPKVVRDVMHYELKEIERKARKLKDLLENKKRQLG